METVVNNYLFATSIIIAQEDYIRAIKKIETDMTFI